jgi:2'-5' RNA ligase
LVVASGQIRAFVALPMPGEVQRYLHALQRRMANAAPYAVRWVDAGAMHLTLKFLGDIPEAQVPDIAAVIQRAAAAAAPLRLPLVTVGCFPAPHNPRVIWAGLGGDVVRLRDLQRVVDDGLTALGFAPETREFEPHITLGRVRDTTPPDDVGSLARMLAQPPSFSGAPAATVDRIVLVKSTLTPAGSVYEHLVEARLTAEMSEQADQGA